MNKKLMFVDITKNDRTGLAVSEGSEIFLVLFWMKVAAPIATAMAVRSFPLCFVKIVLRTHLDVLRIDKPFIP